MIDLFSPVDPMAGVVVILGSTLVALIPFVLLGIRWGQRAKRLRIEGRLETPLGTYTFTPKEGGKKEA